MPRVLAAMLDHENKDSMDGGTKNWKMPGSQEMMESCHKSPNCILLDSFVFEYNSLCF